MLVSKLMISTSNASIMDNNDYKLILYVKVLKIIVTLDRLIMH